MGTMLVCAFVKELRVLQIIVFMMGRFFATYAMNVGFQYTVEVMPTCLRGQGIALVNVMSMVSQMASPYIVYSSVISEKAPFLIIAVLCVLGAIPASSSLRQLTSRCRPLSRTSASSGGTTDFSGC